MKNLRSNTICLQLFGVTDGAKWILRSVAMLLTVSLTCHGLQQNVQAQIDGFNFLTNWTFNSTNDTYIPAIGEDFVEITAGSFLGSNLWFNERQNIEEFSASFRYRANNGPSGAGATFILHNDPDGLGAVTGSRFDFGFSDIAPSAGVTIEMSGQRTGFYLDGVVGSSSQSFAPHSPFGDGFQVTIEYNGSLLTVTIQDDDVADPFVRIYPISDLVDRLGSAEAYVGFGAGTGTGTVTQTLSDVRFFSGPPILGDVNCDGAVNLADVTPFVDLITNGVFLPKADINQDGEVNLLDVGPFIDLLAP